MPRGKAFSEAVERWKLLRTDDDAKFDTTVELNMRDIRHRLPGGRIRGW